MLKRLLQFILKILAWLMILRYHPKIVAITGNVGKTSTKEAIYCVLSTKYKVRKNEGNYNNEIGVPLTILGLEPAGKSFLGWFNNFLKSIFSLIFSINYPEILILEMAADRPGDIKYFADFIKPHISVVTKIGTYPVHLEFFPNIESLITEKRKLVEILSQDDFAILNFDDEKVRIMREKTKAQILTFGLSKFADVKASSIIPMFDTETKEFLGISYKIEYQGKIVPVKLNKIIGSGQIYATLAATAVGLVLEINLVEISEAFLKYKSPQHRLSIISGIKKTIIIDDTYNASPASMIEALDVLSLLSSERKNEIRKIAVLGDMLELGVLSEEAHRLIGRKIVEEGIDILFLVGERAKFIGDEAQKLGYPSEKIFEFCTSSEAAVPVQNEIKEGDIILVKGSHAMMMNKIVEEIKFIDPLKALPLN